MPDDWDGDVVVVGAGVMGSATAWALQNADPSRKIALLEQYDFGHRRGSSHGHSRIIRPVYHQKHYAAMMPEAYARWEELEKASGGATIYTKTGGLWWGPPKSQEQSKAICDAQGVEYEILTPEEVEARWPPLTAREGWQGLYQPDTGILHADNAVAALQRQARALGTSLHAQCVVTEIEGGGADGEAVTVTTADGRNFTAAKAVITAGAWAGKLLERTTGLQLALQPTQNTVAYWPTSRPELFRAGTFPVLLSSQLYSLPSWAPDEIGYWKIDFHGGTRTHALATTLISACHRAVREAMAIISI